MIYRVYVDMISGVPHLHTPLPLLAAPASLALACSASWLLLASLSAASRLAAMCFLRRSILRSFSAMSFCSSSFSFNSFFSLASCSCFFFSSSSSLSLGSWPGCWMMKTT